MAVKQTKKQTKIVYRSIVEFRKHFLPKSYEKELSHEKSKHPERFGTGLAEEFLKGVRRKLRRS